MRNTICIEEDGSDLFDFHGVISAFGSILDALRSDLCKLIFLMTFGFSMPMAAQQLSDGCYTRVYSTDHLAGQPDQVIWKLRLLVRNAGRDARIEAVAANQGHARRDGHMGKVLVQDLICDGATCRAECDAGRFTVTRRSGDALTFRLDYLLLGDTADCEAYFDMAEKPDTPVSYRVNRAPRSACEGV